MRVATPLRFPDRRFEGYTLSRGPVRLGQMTGGSDAQKGLQAAAIAAQFVPVYGQIIGAVLSVVSIIVGFFDSGPSAAWLSFPKRLKATLDAENHALQGLAEGLTAARSEAELLAAVDTYKHEVEAGGVGGFAAEGGPWDIVTPPGATGTEHEGKLTVNWEDITSKIRQLLDAQRTAITSGAYAVADQVQAAASRATPPTPPSAAVASYAPAVSTPPPPAAVVAVAAPFLVPASAAVLVGGGLLLMLVLRRL